jgi:hypothetical protein
LALVLAVEGRYHAVLAGPGGIHGYFDVGLRVANDLLDFAVGGGIAQGLDEALPMDATSRGADLLLIHQVLGGIRVPLGLSLLERGETKVARLAAREKGKVTMFSITIVTS